MVYKEIVGNELYVYMSNNGKMELLYKRWLNYGYGRVFSGVWGSFTAKDVESFRLRTK